MVEMLRRPHRSNQWVRNAEYSFTCTGIPFVCFLPLVLVFILDLVCCWATEAVGYARSPSACPLLVPVFCSFPSSGSCIYSRSRVL
jgi:hypothetical protein